jgi:hypothetical protein
MANRSNLLDGKIVIAGSSVGELNARNSDNATNVVIQESLDRYFYALSVGRSRLADLFAENELGFMVDIMNGTWAQCSSRYFAANLFGFQIEDALANAAYVEKWSMDVPVFQAKVKSLDSIQTLALVDAIEVYWSQTTQGVVPEISELLTPKEAIHRS